jgi:MscS family membrane protein
MRKKIFRIIKHIIFYIPIVFVLWLFCHFYLFYDNQLKTSEDVPSQFGNYSIFTFLSSGETARKETFNQKTPRALFAKFLNENIIIWCGYFRDSYQAIDCIAHEKFDLQNSYELEKHLDKCEMLFISLLSISFKYDQIPLTTQENALELALGTGKNRITYYLEKRNNGDWFFTEKNFTNPKIIKTYKNYLKRVEDSKYDSLESPTPGRAYINFMFGCLDRYDFSFNDALAVLNLKNIPKIIKEKYNKFISFVLFKVLTTKKISVTSISGEPSDSKIEILYVKHGVGSIYLKKVYIGKTGNYKWIFPARVIRTALRIFMSDDTMVTSPNDPLSFRIQHCLFVNFRFLNNKIFGIKYLVIILFLFGIYILFFVYKYSRIIFEFILSLLGQSIKNYPLYSKRFSIFSALIAAVIVSHYFFTASIIYFYHIYLYYAYILAILYTVLIIGWLCEVLNIICLISVYILKQKGSKGFRAVFVVEIIRRLCGILIVIILIGFLLNKLGVNMLNFLTALGIGGIAVAFAGKDTIENLFGSIMIALEKPFKLGDWIVIGGDFEGVVENVGLRSTRIRTFEDSFLTVPNVKFITKSVNNMGKRTYRRYTTTLDLEDSTSSELIKSFTAGITELIKKTSSMRKGDCHIRVNDIGESSIKILVYVFFVTPDWAAELRERERFILNILRLANELNIKFAYPTQTLLLSKYKSTDKKDFEDMDLSQLNEATRKAKKKAGNIIERFKRKPPKKPQNPNY